MSMILGGEDRRKTVGNERIKGGQKKANSIAKERVWKLTAWAVTVHQLSQCN